MIYTAIPNLMRDIHERYPQPEPTRAAPPVFPHPDHRTMAQVWASEGRG